jgi:hypothetical protein
MDQNGQYINTPVVTNNNLNPNLPDMNKNMNFSKVVQYMGIFLGGLALILSVVALILYSVIPQPVTRPFTKDTITTSTARPTFTPTNMTLFTTTPLVTASLGGGGVGATATKLSSDSVGMFYIIHNKSTSVVISIYNADSNSAITTINPEKAQLFIIDEAGKSVSVGPSP